MDTLLNTFPDALIVQTHRDPLQLIPSVSSLVLSARRMQEPEVRAAEVGKQQLGTMGHGYWIVPLRFARPRPENFLDVYFY